MHFFIGTPLALSALREENCQTRHSDERPSIARPALLHPFTQPVASATTETTVKKIVTTLGAVASLTAAISSSLAALPDPGMQIEKGRTALVVTDPQNDFLSPNGVTWGVVGKNVEANKTVENIDDLFKVAKAEGIPVFISPHYYYPHDHGWQFEGALEKLMHDIGMFDRKGPLHTDGFEGSGADWLERYKPYINDGHTTVTSPHKVYGPETNDLVLQLRKQGIDKVVLAGMSANLCTESHMRELLEQGFEVAVVSDATAAAQVEEGDGYAAALVNFRYMANTVWTTDQATQAMQAE
ncbi:MAG: cysteine hydrolase [Gammaproteobacteria bacterium]|nr:cysteine hydrolase [Gammaproteobacteria bacterium]